MNTTSLEPGPAPWQPTAPARTALDRIVSTLTGKGWRPVHPDARTGSRDEPLAVLADPTATARLELCPDRATAPDLWHLGVRLTGHLRPTPDLRPGPAEWQVAFTGPQLDPDAVARAALAAPDLRPEPQDALTLAVSDHAWTSAPGWHEHGYRAATSPDHTRALSYVPCDDLAAPTSELPWLGQATDPATGACWILTANHATPARVLAAALLDTRPAEQVPDPPQHALHQLLTAHGFTAHLWQRLELVGVHEHHLADVYLRRRPGGPLVAITAVTGSAGNGPEIEVCADTGEPFGEGGDLDGALCADCRTGANLGHATFTPTTPHQAVLAYADALTHR